MKKHAKGYWGVRIREKLMPHKMFVKWADKRLWGGYAHWELSKRGSEMTNQEIWEAKNLVGAKLTHGHPWMLPDVVYRKIHLLLENGNSIEQVCKLMAKYQLKKPNVDDTNQSTDGKSNQNMGT